MFVDKLWVIVINLCTIKSNSIVNTIMLSDVYLMQKYKLFNVFNVSS